MPEYVIRVMVRAIIYKIQNYGMTVDEVLAEYTKLTNEQKEILRKRVLENLEP